MGRCRDGAEALDYLFGTGQYAQNPPAFYPRVILLDLKPPKVSGLEVLRRIKESPDLRFLPIVVLTSSKEGPDIQECYALGVNSYVVKPVDFQDFVRVVSEVGLYWLLLNQPPEKAP